MTGSNKTCAFFVLYLHIQALFHFSFQFFSRLAAVMLSLPRKTRAMMATKQPNI